MRSAPTSAGVVGEDGEAGADAGLDKEGALLEVLLADLAEDVVHGGDDRRDGDAGDGGEGVAVGFKETAEDDAELVRGAGAGGGDAPVGDGGGVKVGGGTGGGTVEAEHGVGVADVDGEEHG